MHYIYDAWNRLVKVVSISDSPTSSSSSSSSEPSSITVATYAYDGLTRRITKTTDDDTQNYYYSKDWQVLEAYGENAASSASEVVTQWFWGLRGVDDLVERIEIPHDGATSTLFALSDQWNVVAVTDSSAAVQERYGYNAFGATLFMTASFGSISESSFGWETTFCGYRLDEETGFYQVRYRYLHPTLGRWLSRDPIGDPLIMAVVNDGTLLRSSRSLSSPAELRVGPNLYTYVRNEPIDKTDPSGLIAYNPDPLPPLIFPAPLLGGYLSCTIYNTKNIGVRKPCKPKQLAACAAATITEMELGANLGAFDYFQAGCASYAKCFQDYY